MKSSTNQATAAWLKVDGHLPPKVLQRFGSRDSHVAFCSPCLKKEDQMCWRGCSWLSGPALELGGSNGKMLGIWEGQESEGRLGGGLDDLKGIFQQQ